jgi:hypothetical protein
MPMATLIESLAAMAVFAIGAAGSATWVAHASARSAAAGQRLRALAVATDMESRLRANPEGVRSGDYRYAIPAEISPGPAPVAGLSIEATAADDLASFQGDIRRALGADARGAVRCAAARCAVVVRWPGGRLDWGVSP